VAVSLTNPIVLKGGDQLVVDAEGSGCVYAYYVIVKTSDGYYSTVVNA
jgi:TfoX/Sxy family transcriptional regulator of competence genes